MKIAVQKGQFFADGFAVRRFFLLEEGETRLISYLSDAGCGAARIALQEGKLFVTEGKIGVIRWKEGAELYPLPARSERVEKILSLSEGREVHCTLDGDLVKMVVEGADVFTHRTIRPLFSPTISLIEGQRTPVLDLRAKCDEGEYVAILSVAESGTKLLLEEVGEHVSAAGNEITLRRRFDDLARRTVLTRCIWQGNGFRYSREIVCAREHTFIREQSGRELLEAAYAKDESSIAAMLSPEMGDASAILDYFGEIVALRAPLFSASPTAYAAIKRKGDDLVGMTYDLVLNESGKIINIVSDEEE